MTTEIQIINKHRKRHDELSRRYYLKQELSKEEFDREHGQNWQELEAELISEGFRPPPEPDRDLASEIDDLTARVAKVEQY